MQSHGGDLPVLWHLSMSHYNEKARWALDYKRVPHVRRSVMPGVHQLVARRLSGGATFPILQMDGATHGESAAIIAALEARVPTPSLYPADPALRRDALALEARFDDVLAPAMRHALYQEILNEPEVAVAFLSTGGTELRRSILKNTFPLFKPALARNFKVPERTDPGPRRIILEEVSMIGELAAGTGFLVGDSFTVADLAACSFLIPFVDIGAMPEQMPALRGPIADFASEVARTPGGQWVAATYAAHRRPPGR